MSLHESFRDFLEKNNVSSSFDARIGKSGGYITFSNSGKRGTVKEFSASLDAIEITIADILKNLSDFKRKNASSYVESIWRDLGDKFFSDLSMNSMIAVQTKPVFTTLSKIISWANDKAYLDDNQIILDEKILRSTLDKLKDLITEFTPHEVKTSKSFHSESIQNNMITFPKPFILLAGISGTGKTRFVRKQAEATAAGRTNYCHVAVRPDWHEPSDLLGYISRIGIDGARYVVTDVLHFMVQAWADIAESADTDGHIALQTTGVPFWLCLDEMNLAPVEQYFADFLSVLETRQWEGGEYTCDPLLKPDVIRQLDEAGRQKLRNDLGLAADALTFLWEAFITKGISIPPNLMVAGTVNMDETTHGFSRKVIDRAFTVDFGVFFPNDYDQFFTPKTTFRPLTYAQLTQVNREDLQTVTADPDGSRSIAFLKAVNALLKNTPFELAYRALNELLLAVVCFHPNSEIALQAVWDDFLMAKVLPRIEGDSDKLGTDTDGQALPERLAHLLQTEFSAIHGEGKQRPDWFNISLTGEATVMTQCRSVDTLHRMQQRLDAQGFSAFWP